MNPEEAASLAKHQFEDGVGQWPEGCAQQIGAVPPALFKYSLGVTEPTEAFDSVINTHAARADTAERQIVLCVVHERAVDRDVTGGRAAQHLASVLAIATVVVKRQRPRLCIDIPDGLVEIAV